MAFDVPFTLADGPDEPVFLRLARTIVRDVRRGRLRPGDALPGSRPLAASLGLHRNTVLAAYRELAAEGWIETTLAKGTFVTRKLPEPKARRFAREAPTRAGVAERPGFELPEAPAPWEPTVMPEGGAIALYGGVPDVSLLPHAALARAYRRALRQHGARVLSYGDPRGAPSLRAALASLLASVRGLPASADDVLVTRGSQMALDLVARALLRPGDVVAVEALGYRPAWEALAATGARLVPVRVDAEGLVVDDLAKLVREGPLRAVYVTPHHQYPTTVLLAPGRRLALLALAREARFAVLEDDYDHEFHYDGRPVLPLASADTAGSVVYIGTLSKVLAPGLRIGFVVAPRRLAERLVHVRTFVDRQGDHAIEQAIAELIEDGELERHVRKAKRVYEARRDAFVQALRAQLGDSLVFTLPPGGMALWARVRGAPVEALGEAAAREGVLLQTARRFTFEGRAPQYLRLGFATHPEKVLREAVRRLQRAHRAVSSPGPW